MIKKPKYEVYDEVIYKKVTILANNTFILRISGMIQSRQYFEYDDSPDNIHGKEWQYVMYDSKEEEIVYENEIICKVEEL